MSVCLHFLFLYVVVVVCLFLCNYLPLVVGLSLEIHVQEQRLVFAVCCAHVFSVALSYVFAYFRGFSLPNTFYLFFVCFFWFMGRRLRPFFIFYDLKLFRENHTLFFLNARWQGVCGDFPQLFLFPPSVVFAASCV